jgi:hypothetical protein
VLHSRRIEHREERGPHRRRGATRARRNAVAPSGRLRSRHGGGGLTRGMAALS